MKADSEAFKALAAFCEQVGPGEIKSEKIETYFYVFDHPKDPQEKLIAYLDLTTPRRRIFIRRALEGFFGSLEELPLVYDFPVDLGDRSLFPTRTEFREGPINLRIVLHYDEGPRTTSTPISSGQYERLRALFNQEDLPWEEEES